MRSKNPSLKLSENTVLIFDPNMTSIKPYFIQALHQWISDNDLTPLIVIDASYPGLRVPAGIAEDEKITLNVSWGATDHLSMDEELMTFSARFSGRSQALIVPMESIVSIFARENGKGMVFEVDTEPNAERQKTKADKPNKPTVSELKKSKNKDKENKRPHLTIVD